VSIRGKIFSYYHNEQKQEENNTITNNNFAPSREVICKYLVVTEYYAVFPKKDQTMN
jgi:hypothetical protein